MDVKEAMKGSKAFLKAMQDAAAAAEQMDEQAREQTGALKDLTAEMRAMREAFATQATAGAEQSAALTRAIEAQTQTANALKDAVLAQAPEDEGNEVAAIETMSRDLKAVIAGVAEAVKSNKPAPAAKDRTGETLAALDTVAAKLDRLIDLMLQPVELETDLVGDPVRAVRKEKK